MKKITLISLFSVFALSSSMFSAEDTGAEGKIAPEARAIVKKISDFIKAQKKISVDIDMEMKINAEGMKQEFNAVSFFALERPDKVAYIVKGGLMGSTMICDGKKVYTCIPMMKKYTETDFSGKVEDLTFNSGNQGLPVAEMFVAEDPENEIMKGVVSAELSGVEKLGDLECSHLKFKQEEIDWEMWVRTGDKPLIEKIVPDFNKMMKKLIEMQGGGGPGINYEIRIIFKNWNIGGNLPPDTFKFVPPQGVEKSDSLSPEALEENEPEAEASEETALGGEAQDFELETLDGGKFKLSENKGKNIVVLDFWATWCPPCRKSLPVIAATTGKYKDKGVVFCAVNQGDKKEKIKEFMDKEKIKCAVALDVDTKIGDIYGATSIPRTVIIGKDGKIQSVHVGYVENLAKVLEADIDKLLSGKSLIDEKAK